MSTYTTSQSETFTITHAKHIASKVATDLLRLQRFYGSPSDIMIDQYEEELVALLKGGFLKEATYGFKRNNNWVEALRYNVLSGGSLTNQDPGRILPGINVEGASFGSYVTYSSEWWKLSDTERADFKAGLSITRGDGNEPGIENGGWSKDLTYSAGGKGITRSTILR